MESRWRALAVLAAARIAMGFQFQAVASVAPLLKPDLGLDHAQIGLLVGLFMAPGIVIALPGGLLGAKFGDARMVLVGLGLLAIGGGLCAVAPDYPTLVVARTLAGIGGVLLNVLMTKMVADWFAGREIVLAMSILINTWPIGIGLALLGAGPLAEAGSWRAGFAAAGLIAAVGLLAIAALYRPAPDAAPPPAGLGFDRITSREFAMVCVAALPWMFYNGAYATLVAFLPTFFLSVGHSVAGASNLAGAQTLVIILSVQAGGILVQRFGRPDLVVGIGIIGWVAVLAALSVTPWPFALMVLGGLIGGLPPSVLVSLPAGVLSAKARGPGNGVFFTIFYLGMAAYPPLAGRLLDMTGNPAAPILLAGATLLLCLLLLHWFRFLQRRYLLVRT